MLIVNPEIYKEIIKSIENGKKIAAIKSLRKETGSGLREAKDAIERFQHENFGGNYPHAAKSGLSIICSPVVKKVTLDYGKGEIEVDLEEMELRALMEMPVLGLDAVHGILSLVNILQAFSEGKKIEVVDEV